MRLDSVFNIVNRLDKEKRLILAFSLVGLISLLAKTSTPFLVSFFYQHHCGALLNLLSGVSISAPLASIDFYLGMVEQASLGPLSMIFSVLAFLLFSMKYLRNTNMVKFFFAIFLFLLITKWEILFFPPTGDAITGPFAEAVWLHQNNFNYIDLARQPTFIHGGAKIYLFSIYPSFLAIGMNLISNTKLFLFFNHLIALGLAAGVVVFFRSFLLKLFNQRIALLLSVLLLSIPVFQGQAESINMDMPALFFSMWAIYALSQQRFLRSAVLASIAIAIKVYLSFIGFTIFGMCLLFFLVQEKEEKKLCVLFYGFIPFAFGLIQAFLLFFFLKADSSNYAVGFFLGRKWLLTSPALYLYIFSLLFFIIFVIKKVFVSPQKNFIFFFRKYYCIIACFLATFGWFILFGQSLFIGVRYYLQILPFFICCIAWLMMFLFKSRRVVICLVVIFIFLANVFSYGGPEFKQGLAYRSRVRFQSKLVKEIEKNFSTFTIAAFLHTAQALGIRELGYAQKVMDVRIYFWPSKYGGIRELKKEDIFSSDRIVWVQVVRADKSSLMFPRFDRLLSQVSYGNHRARIFVGGMKIFLILKMSEPVIDEFEQRDH